MSCCGCLSRRSARRCPRRHGRGLQGLPGGIGVTNPTYSLYPVLAAIHDTPVVEVERGERFELPPPEDVAKVWNDAGCRLAFIVNPHAPSGRLESIETLGSLAAAFRGVLVIDEAYVDFAQRDALDLLREEKRENVVILRSLSKGLLAGWAAVRIWNGGGWFDRGDGQGPRQLQHGHPLAAGSGGGAERCGSGRGGADVAESDSRAGAGFTSALRDMQWQVLPSESNFLLCTPAR